MIEFHQRPHSRKRDAKMDPSVKVVNVEEITLTCTDGVQLAAQRWTPNNRETCTGTASGTAKISMPTRILCLHGYLDNCRSFHVLAPRLVSGCHHNRPQSPVDLVALDFPGHGRSSHKSSDHPPMMVISDLVFYVSEVVRLLEWQSSPASSFSSSCPIVLIGHSMGSIVAIQYAAAFPTQIQSLVILDGYGPEAEPASNVTERLRQHITLRYKINTTSPLTKKVYPTIAAATKTRMKTARNCPGNQWLSETAARELVQRALVPQFRTNTTMATTSKNTRQAQSFVFRHDPRLVAIGPILLHTQEQVDEYWKGLAACRQTIWLRAEFGWPFDPILIRRAEEELLLRSSSSSKNHCQQHTVVKVLPGSHHFHADPETVDQVAMFILNSLMIAAAAPSIG